MGLLSNKPLLAIAGLGFGGSAYGAMTTRYRDDGTAIGMSARSLGRGMAGGAIAGGMGALGVGAARYGRSAYREGLGAAGKLARSDWRALLGLFK